MARETALDPRAPKPFGPYSAAVRIGPIVAASGQYGIMPDTSDLVSDDVGEQTTQALRNIEAALAGFGVSLDDVLHVRVHLEDASVFDVMNRAYESCFTPPYPSRITAITKLRLPGAHVEIEALAVIIDA